ncbi:hypothetical protein BSLG_008265 [Batrachochytrium salamandrivorans]|nr:hypothetical protein BSLG_008265 [Batrachochytrium salamandrivorans]
MALQLASNAALPWAVNRQRPLTALLVSAVSIGVILSIACFEQGRFWITRPTRHAMLKHRWTLASLNEDSNSTSNTDTDEDGNAVSDYDCDCRETLKSGCLETCSRVSTKSTTTNGIRPRNRPRTQFQKHSKVNHDRSSNSAKTLQRSSHLSLESCSTLESPSDCPSSNGQTLVLIDTEADSLVFSSSETLSDSSLCDEVYQSSSLVRNMTHIQEKSLERHSLDIARTSTSVIDWFGAGLCFLFGSKVPLLALSSSTDNDMARWRQTLFNSLDVAGRFVNPFMEWQDRNTADLFEYIKHQFTRNNRNNVPTDIKELERTMPLETPQFDLIYRYTLECGKMLINSASASRRMSDYSQKGVRFQPPASPLEEACLMTVTWIDISVVKKLGNSAKWYVPLGMRAWFEGYGVTNVVELDWWQEHKHDDSLIITGTPIQHWSGRHFLDVNLTLWSSFVVRGPTCSFFHCGDTGYCQAFKEIGRRLGPITFASLPIGSYEPREYMRHQHMNPFEACLVHKDIGATFSLGVHWGTFMMSDEHYLDPPKHLEEGRIENGLPSGSIFTAKLGETLTIALDCLADDTVVRCA